MRRSLCGIAICGIVFSGHAAADDVFWPLYYSNCGGLVFTPVSTTKLQPADLFVPFGNHSKPDGEVILFIARVLHPGRYTPPNDIGTYEIEVRLSPEQPLIGVIRRPFSNMSGRCSF